MQFLEAVFVSPETLSLLLMVMGWVAALLGIPLPFLLM